MLELRHIDLWVFLSIYLFKSYSLESKLITPLLASYDLLAKSLEVFADLSQPEALKNDLDLIVLIAKAERSEFPTLGRLIPAKEAIPPYCDARLEIDEISDEF